MQFYPEVQIKVQEELDRVVGQDRFPTLADRPYLPYTNAVVKEILRWHTIGPICAQSNITLADTNRLTVSISGPPHATTQDDIYEGYFIPKGAMVLVNIW